MIRLWEGYTEAGSGDLGLRTREDWVRQEGTRQDQELQADLSLTAVAHTGVSWKNN